MDPPSKRSRTTAPPNEPCLVDRLSSLPDDVLHHVLSYLDFIDVVRTSVLSKRWRTVWTLMPYLNFDMDRFLKNNYSYRIQLVEPCRKFWDFIKWALLLRDGSQIIRICLHTYNTPLVQLHGLLRVAAKQKLQELCLVYENRGFEDLEFPRALCETLAVLTLRPQKLISLQLAANFSSLRSLNLSRVCVSRDVVEKLLSNDCVKVENVRLEDCRANYLEQIIISARHLRNLTIVNLSTSGKFWVFGGFESELRVIAPKLVSFYYSGTMLRSLSLLNTVSLKNATIRLLRAPQVAEDKDPNHTFCASRFIGLDHAKTLTLSTLVVKSFCSTISNPLRDTFMLDKLNNLELELRYNTNHIEGLINLLKLSPNLEGLIISFKQIHWPRSQKNRKVTENGSSWKSREEDIACLSNHVKVIQISNLDGSKISLELVKFLLQNGKVLEKMEIMHRGGKRRAKRFNKLVDFPKASSKVLIYFAEYTQRKTPWFDREDSNSEYDN